MAHFDIDLVTMVLAGELPPRVLVRVLYDHLKELCPECRQALEAVQGSLPRTTGGAAAAGAAAPSAVPAGADAYEAAIAAASARVAGQVRAAEDERRRARREVAALRALPAEQRSTRIAAAHVRFRSRSFVERLLAAAQELLRDDPREASQLAGLVPVALIAAGTAHTPWGQELRVRGLACRGNALRLLGDLAAADACFAELRRRLATAKLDDLALHAEVCSLEASLRLDQRRFTEAEDLLDRMVLLTRLAGDDLGLAKAQIQRASLLGQRDQLDAAADGLREALRLLAGADEPKLIAAAAGNLAILECERGRYDAAADLLAGHRELLSGGGAPWAVVRVLGLEARIAHGLGRHEESAEKYLAAHRLALAKGFEYDAALAALELALLHAEQGRFAEVREIAATVQPLFASREVHREATAALLLFQQAVAAERITVEAVRSLRDALQRSGQLPAAAAQRERPS